MKPKRKQLNLGTGEKTMIDRDRLIKLIETIDNNPEKTCPHFNENDCFDCPYDKVETCNMSARKADYLLANGVIVPSFKVGDKVYQIDAERVYELDISDVYFYKKWIYETKSIDFDIESIGKSLFLTKEEAEEKLKELRK